MIFNKKAQKLNKFTDGELLLNYSNSYDQIYLAELFNKYSHLIFLTCMKYLRDSDSASDAVMDIYEQLVEKLKYEKVENFKSWIYVVAKNKCLMELRKKKKNEKIKIFDLNLVESDSFFHHEDEKLFNFRELESKINELVYEQRECIRMFYFNKLSYREIADAKSWDEKKVKSCLQNGKRNLRLALLKLLEGN